MEFIDSNFVHANIQYPSWDPTNFIKAKPFETKFVYRDEKDNEQYRLIVKGQSRLLDVVDKEDFDILANEIMKKEFELKDMTRDERQDIYDKMKIVTDMCYFTGSHIKPPLFDGVTYACTYYAPDRPDHVQMTDRNQSKLLFKVCVHPLHRW
jgi:hypothetical protein